MAVFDDLPPLECIENCRILVVGDVMVDRYWYGEVARISPEAPVPVVHINREECRLGGAANVALNVKALGAQTTLISIIGRDKAGQELREMLQKNGVKAELGEDPSMETIVKLRVIGRMQQMLRVDFEKEPVKEILAGMFENYTRLLPLHDVVLFSDYGKGGLANVAAMIEYARKAGKVVLVDPKGVDYSRYSGASVITPNRSELELVVGAWNGEDDLAQRAQVMLDRFDFEALLLTRSEEGMTLFQQGARAVHASAEAREVADVTGAGDTVIAIIAILMACRVDLGRAVNVANRAGGLAVGKFGTAVLTYDELQNNGS
jgi:rfaE bifunctional protein kinase chain/domain